MCKNSPLLPDEAGLKKVYRESGLYEYIFSWVGGGNCVLPYMCPGQSNAQFPLSPTNDVMGLLLRFRLLPPLLVTLSQMGLRVYCGSGCLAGSSQFTWAKIPPQAKEYF